MTTPRAESERPVVMSGSIPTGERLIPHRPGLDGLRGLSVAAVLAYHHGWEWATGGFLGVSVFFTLSGFLITSLILAEHDRKGRVNLVHFWGRRFRRLLPASLVALVGIGVFGLTVATAEQAERLAGDIGAAVAYVANWRFVFDDTSYGDLFAEPSPVLHFWSLAIEEQFYLLYPLFMVGLLAITRGRRVPIAMVLTAAALGSIAMSFILGTDDLDRIYFGTDTRAIELLAGALLALAVLMAPSPPPAQRTDRADGSVSPRGGQRFMVGWVPSIFGGAAIAALGLAVATVETDTLWLYRGGFAAISVLSCVAIAGSTRDGPLANVLGTGPLTWLGLRSYGIYLFHWPIFLWLDPGTTGLDGVALFALRVAVTFGVSELSYRLIEMPIRFRRPLPRPVLGLAPVGAAVAVAIGLLATANAPAPLVDLDQSVDALPPPPVLPVDPADMVVVGDGVAGALATELDASFGRRLRWDVADLSNPDCPAIALHTDACLGTVDEWVAAAEGARVVVLSFGAGAVPVDAEAPDPTVALSQLRALLGDGEARLVWVTQPVILAEGDPLARQIDPARTAWPRQAVLNASVEAASASSGDELVDLAGYLSRSVEHDGTGESILDHDDERLLNGLGWAADQVFAMVGQAQEVAPDATRILVVGDSVAYSVGRGLEEWGADTGAAVVWNVGTTGCGLARGGVVPDYEIQPSPVCEMWPDRFARHLEEFDPDVVVVVSTGWDLLERRLPEWPAYLAPGAPLFDDWLLSEYRQVVDSLSALGAPVAWVTSPCASPERLAGGSVFSPERMQAQNRLIARLGETDPRVAVVDLDALACPDGRFTNSIDGVSNFRPDGVHFSDPGSRWVADGIGPELVDLTQSTE